MSSVIRLNNQVNATANQTFLGTSAVQTFTVPNGVFWIRFFLWGAGGTCQDGSKISRPDAAGSGSYVEGNLRTAPGTVYYIIVGRAGLTGLNNGGGGSGFVGTNGGGFTGIFSGSPAFGNAIAIAGGGGGSGTNNGNYYGGGGGYPSGGNGTGGATGGTQSAGGSGSSAGSQLQGANGGGGGGGGGYYGGGAGTGGNPSTGGGGGSSYYMASVINPITVNGINTATVGTNTLAANESSPYWVSPYGRSGYDGYAVIGFNASTSSLPIQITLGNVLSSTGTAFTSDNTTYTFPANVSKVRVFVWGGGGGNKGGSGAHVAGDINKGSMTTLTIYLNRGGGLYGPGGGVVAGGYGAVYNSTNGYLMIAGAGGTGGDKYGGGGGYLQGSQGGTPSLPGTRTTVRNYSNGGGGSQTQGGQGGFGNDSGNYISGAPGGYLQGGDGNRGSAYGQGGGGGYYGGGGGNGDANGGGFYTGNGAGGGGSSYVNPGFVTNYKGEDGLNGSTTSVLPGGASSPFYVSGYGVGALSGGGGGALVVIVPYLSGGGGSSASSTAPAQITLGSSATRAIGGTRTIYGSYYVHTFTTVGTSTFVVTPPNSLTVKALIVAGGGGGGGSDVGGGGGAGGAVYQRALLLTPGTYTVTVGAGGAQYTTGGNSSFLSYVGYGGGSGGAGNGGCGGGGSGEQGGGTGSQGYNGSYGNSQYTGGGGGGGMGAPGTTYRDLWVYGYGHFGGDGMQSAITGTPTYYAGGGGGATGGLGGKGGGGRGYTSGTATPGTNGLGGGGGGGAAGGSGTVIITYLMNGMTAVPFLPTSLGSLAIWLDSADTSSMTFSGQNITQWNDKSGNGNHMTGTGAAYPTLGTTTTGKQCIALGGSAFFSRGTTTMTGGSSTMFIVASATTDNLGLMNYGNNQKAMSFQLYYNGSVGNYFFSSHLFYNSNATCVITENVGVSCTCYFNGTRNGSQSSVAVGSGGNLYVGSQSGNSTGNWVGNIQEFIYFNAALTDSQREQIEGYLAWKWGTQASLPGTHPYKYDNPF